MEDLRIKFVSLRLTNNEYELLKQLAYENRLTVSAYIRKILFQKREDI